MTRKWNNFIYNISNIQFIRHISFLWHWKNFFFLLKYPFLRVYNRWDNKFMGYYVTEFDYIPDGWRIAFGKDLIRDIKKAGKESRKRLNKHLSWKSMITWEQIKEKYGTLRLDASCTDEIMKVLDKYEFLSMFYCINCGKSSRYMTRDWIEYYCEDCFEKTCSNLSSEKLKEYKELCKITKEDLPIITRYKDGKYYDVDIEKEYNINLSNFFEKQ